MSTNLETSADLMQLMVEKHSERSHNAALFSIAAGLFAVAAAIEDSGISPELEGHVGQIATELGGIGIALQPGLLDG